MMDSVEIRNGTMEIRIDRTDNVRGRIVRLKIRTDGIDNNDSGYMQY